MAIRWCRSEPMSWRPFTILATAFIAALGLGSGRAQELDSSAAAAALRTGGYVIVMRHASSPGIEPDALDAAPGNIDLERQLDERGRRTATAMGESFRRLALPIGEILSSPRFRAMQTAELLQLGEAQPVPELGDDGQGMSRDAAGLRSAWLRAEAAEAPSPGTNRLMITHSPNMLGAFGAAAAGVDQGESLIIRPEGGAARVIARIRIEQWTALAPELPRQRP
jgi:phosphohistidine phosphatase SixA